MSGRGAWRERHWAQVALRVVEVQGATLLIIVAAALLMTGNTSGLYWQAAGTGVCLLGGITDAWVLLIEILR